MLHIIFSHHTACTSILAQPAHNCETCMHSYINFICLACNGQNSLHYNNYALQCHHFWLIVLLGICPEMRCSRSVHKDQKWYVGQQIWSAFSSYSARCMAHHHHIPLNSLVWMFGLWLASTVLVPEQKHRDDIDSKQLPGDGSEHGGIRKNALNNLASSETKDYFCCPSGDLDELLWQISSMVPHKHLQYMYVHAHSLPSQLLVANHASTLPDCIHAYLSQIQFSVGVSWTQKPSLNC